MSTTGHARPGDAAHTSPGEPARRRHSDAVNASALTRLNTEWDHLATAPASIRALRRWAEEDPALACWADLHELRAGVHDRSQPERADRILAALVRRAAVDGQHDALAARVVLQLLLPGAVQLTRSMRPLLGDPRLAEATVLSELAIGIATYPWRRRPRRIAANLLLDCRQRITRRHQRHRAETAAGLDLHAERADTASVDHAEAVAAMDELLGWARRHEVITELESLLLVASHVHEIPMQRLARTLGRSRSSLFATRSAAERRLRHALTAAGLRSGGETPRSGGETPRSGEEAS